MQQRLPGLSHRNPVCAEPQEGTSGKSTAKDLSRKNRLRVCEMWAVTCVFPGLTPPGLQFLSSFLKSLNDENPSFTKTTLVS